MGEAFITRRGGGAPLNFKVVGGTKPSNPKENTIWVSNPNLLDFNSWANNVDVEYGAKAVSGNSITLTANANDCYTNFSSNVTQIPCVAGRTYILEWEHSGASGRVYLFPSGETDNLVTASADARKLELTPADGVTFFTFRVGVNVANTTATYSNIRITEKMAEITGWHFGAEEPNVYDIKAHAEDPHQYYAPHVLSSGDILNFVIPQTCTAFDWVRINGIDGKTYAIRYADGSLFTSWNAGVKVGVVISNEKTVMGGAEVFLAKLLTYGSYYHDEGTLWLQTGTTSTVAMNVLKKNSIQVCPLTAMQYIGGEWVLVDAETYQGGKWNDWIHPDIAKIYNLKEVRENGTGGATVTVGKEIVLTSTSGDSSSQGYVAFYSEEKIDVTHYKTLTFKGFRSAFGQGFLVGFRTGNTRYFHWGEHGNDIVASAKVDTTENTYNVDVTSLSGSYYFFINFAGEATAGTASMYLSDFELT